MAKKRPESFEIILYAIKNPEVSVRKLSKLFSVPRSTVHGYITSREYIQLKEQYDIKEEDVKKDEKLEKQGMASMCIEAIDLNYEMFDLIRKGMKKVEAILDSTSNIDKIVGLNHSMNTLSMIKERENKLCQRNIYILNDEKEGD